MDFTAQWLQSVTNASPLTGTGELQLTNAHTKWGDADSIQLAMGFLSPATNQPPLASKSRALWSRLEPYWLDWQCRLVQIQSTEVDAAELLCAGRWRAPELTVTNLHAKLYQGKLDVRAALNIATRVASFHIASDFDAHRIAPLLTKEAQRWIGQFSWETPPRLEGQGFLILPDWTNQQPDWRAEVLPTLRLQGDSQGSLGGKLTSPARRQETVVRVRRSLRISERRACRVLGQPRQTQRYRPRIKEQERRLVERMLALVREHRKPREFYRSIEITTDGDFRRLAQRVDVDLLYRVSTACARAYGSAPSTVAEQWFIERARLLGVEHGPPAPLLLGRHLIEAGFEPGPRMGKLLRSLYELQLDGKITTQEEALDAARRIG